MKFDQMKQSKYLKADDFEGLGPVKLTIKRFSIEPMSDGPDAPVVYYLERDKGMVLNATNLGNLKAIFGDETESALGKTVVLFLVDTTKKDGTPCKGMRLRGPKTAKQDKIETGVQRRPIKAESENPADEMEDEVPF